MKKPLVDDFNKLFIEFTVKAFAFCNSDELDIYYRIADEIDEINKGKQVAFNREKFFQPFYDFKNMVHNNIRKELNLKEIKYQNVQ
jgi:hypothetical protein